MNKEEIAKIISRIAIDAATDEEISAFNTWCSMAQENAEPLPDFSMLEEKMLDQINRQIHKNEKLSYPLWRILSVAASFLVIISYGGYLLLNKPKPSHPPQQTVQQDIHPGKNAATLTLADGRKIPLAASGNGLLATQAGAAIRKIGDGKVIYQPQATGSTSTVSYNTISTANAEQFEITLPDGTIVTLNAASSIKYPTSFAHLKERKVELSGEAWFKVVHQPKQPFRVTTNGQEVEDLGTEFNINGYSNEGSVQTTLLKGSAKVTASESTLLLRPGQQSSYKAGAAKPLTRSSQVNPEAVLAWKNGYFLFAGADITTIMRQLERWYDVKAVYETRHVSDHFNGRISRSADLQQVLKVLELSGVHFKIEGRTIRIN